MLIMKEQTHPSLYPGSCLVVEELAKIDPAVNVMCDVQSTLIVTLFRKYGTPQQRAEYLSEYFSYFGFHMHIIWIVTFVFLKGDWDEVANQGNFLLRWRWGMPCWGGGEGGGGRESNGKISFRGRRVSKTYCAVCQVQIIWRKDNAIHLINFCLTWIYIAHYGWPVSYLAESIICPPNNQDFI